LAAGIGPGARRAKEEVNVRATNWLCAPSAKKIAG